MNLETDPMITIRTSFQTVNQFADLILRSKGKYKSPNDRINDWLSKNPKHRDRPVINFLKTNLRKMIMAEPSQLELLIGEFNSKGYQYRIQKSNSKELNKTGLIIKDIFGYERFRKSSKAVWLSNALNIKSCVYCNTQYSLTVKQKKGIKMLFHLDHFYSKEVYPFLSLSFYNLIPCCASCNMGKSDLTFKLSENIHPYIDSLDDIAKFGTEPASLAKFLLNINKNENEINLLLSLRTKYLGNTKFQKKLANYKNHFRIESQYEQFKDVVAETYMKSLYYNKHRRNELKDFFKNNLGQNLSEDMIKRFVVGNYIESKDLLKRPLAKMMKDISEDFFTHF